MPNNHDALTIRREAEKKKKKKVKYSRRQEFDSKTCQARPPVYAKVLDLHALVNKNLVQIASPRSLFTVGGDKKHVCFTGQPHGTLGILLKFSLSALVITDMMVGWMTLRSNNAEQIRRLVLSRVVSLQNMGLMLHH